MHNVTKIQTWTNNPVVMTGQVSAFTEIALPLLIQSALMKVHVKKGVVQFVKICRARCKMVWKIHAATSVDVTNQTRLHRNVLAGVARKRIRQIVPVMEGSAFKLGVRIPVARVVGALEIAIS